jgi:hypothetical protein
MSYQEKKTIVSLVSGTLLLIAYCIYAFGKAGMANIDNLKFWAVTMLIFIGIGVVSMIVIQIVFHILLSIAIAVKKKLNDESIDDHEIERSLENEMVEDEMAKLIELKANKFGYAFVSVGIIAGIVSIALGAAPFVMMNIVFLSCLFGSLAEGAVQIRYYRKGV